jgi:uncharacterized protein involved in tellurium resistance
MKAYGTHRVQISFVCLIFLLLGMVLEKQAIAATQYEAENATLSGGAAKNTNHTGYSGTGFVDGFYYSTTAQVSFTVNMANAGSATITLRYSAGNGTSTNTGFYVNGTKIKNITCNTTSNWNTWANEVETVTLNAGNNTIAYKAETSSNTSINLDYISVAAVTYSLTMTNDGHGTTSPTGTITVNSGAATSISATAASNYRFVNWTVTSGTATIASSSSASTTVTLTSGNSTIRANFTAITYSLAVNYSGTGTTVPSGTVTVNHGAATSISATPAAGSRFLDWIVTGGTATIANPSSANTTVTLTNGDATIQANFTAISYLLTMTNDGHGFTEPSDTLTFYYDSPISIVAHALAGYQFLNWTVTSGTATIENPTADVTFARLMGNATIRANFSPLYYSLTVTNDGLGTTTPSGTTTVQQGVETPITATPSTGYQFLNWTVTSGTVTIASPASASTTVLLPNGNATIRANFTAIAYTLTVTNSGNGTTNPSGAVTVNHGAATPISATPATGYQFVNWTVTSGTATIASPTSANTTVTLTSGNATVRANFTVLTYTLTMTNDGHGTTVPSGAVTVNYGTATPISATPATGYQFLSWTVTSGTATIVSPASASTTVTLTSGNATILANFTQQFDTITISNNGNGSTIPSGILAVGRGVPITITAAANAGYHFVVWTALSGAPQIANPASSSTAVTLTAGNAAIRADFAQDLPTLPNNRQIAISGELFDDSGNPVGSPNPATVEMAVRLCNHATGGDTLYSEEFLIQNYQGVVVDNGRFVVRLGTGVTSNDLLNVISTNDNLWAEITVLGAQQDVLLPRTPLTASPYSLSGTQATVKP